MPQQTTDGQQIHSGFQKSCRIRMSKSVRSHIFDNPSFLGGDFEHLLNCRRLKRHVGTLAGEHIHRRSIGFPVLAECVQKSRRHRDNSRLLTFPATDSQLHALTVDVAEFQMSHFVQTHSGCVLNEQKRAMLVTLHTREQPIHVFTTQHRWQLFISAGNAL